MKETFMKVFQITITNKKLNYKTSLHVMTVKGKANILFCYQLVIIKAILLARVFPINKNGIFARITLRL